MLLLNDCLMRKVLLLVALPCLLCLTSKSQYTTVTVDGSIGSNEYGSHTSGNNSQGNFYMTWDATNLYVGVTSANTTEGVVIYLDKDPITPVNGGSNSNGTLVGQPYDNTNFAQLQFRADLVLYFKNGYREYRTADGSNGWSAATSGFGSYADNGSGNDTRELAIPWTIIGGLPASFNWFGYATSGGGFVYNQVPTENIPAGFIGTSARYVRYYTVSSTANGSSTYPFSRNSYVFNGTTDETVNDITIYDFTMNTSGVTLTKGATANWTINGNLVVGNGTLTFGNSSGTCEVVTSVNVTGGTLNLNSKSLTLRSTSSGTARIATISGTLSNASNVTVERYVPAKTSRKWSYVASPVTVSTIRLGWQDDVFISGPGTGGAICGSTGGDGAIGTDKYNTNGFDVTPSNTPSMYTYNVTQVNGTRWVTIPNTNATALTSGIGYRMNLRGSRGASDANCGDQLNSTSPPAPAALTLSATGTLAQGDVTVNLNAPATHLYTLIGNPYASEVSFTAFQSDATSNGTGNGSNSANISNKFWAYSSQSSTNNFATYITGTSTNFPAGNTNPTIIASGQAFFVEASSGTASANVIFRESHKSSSTQNGNTMFRTSTWNELIRVKYSDAANNHLDEIVVRFGNDPLITTNENVFDAVSFNSGTYLAGRKANKGFAIQTRPTGFVSDTVRLTVAATDAGNYKLNFSEFEGLVSAPIIQLLDHYTNTVTDVRTQTNYLFSIDANAASQGTNRFELVFKNNSTLPVRTISLSAKQTPEHTLITWSVTGEYNIDSYMVERSQDGRNFKSVGIVAVSSATANQTSYSFQDKDIITGTCYYRIRINDKNGNVSYSVVVKLQSGKAISMHLYPNPVKDQLSIITNAGGNEVYSLRLVNMHGKTLHQQQSRAINGVINVNTGGLSSGMYTVHVINDKGEVITERFVKQ